MYENRTMGRWPRLGELIEYYSRQDIGEIMYYQSTRWRILMNFGDNTLLEPRSPRDASDQIVRKLRDFAQGIREDERLGKYPTMHILKDRGEQSPVRYDFMTEDDPKSWSEAFCEMAKAVDVLDSHGVFYRLKFSGHRSLHLLIPAESLPTTFRGRSINEQHQQIEKRIKAYLPPTGHVTVGFRTVYSTHPKGGMVSIPLRRKELPNFQPWMANIHTVTVDPDWFEVPSDAVARNEHFLNEIFDNDSNGVAVSTPSFEPKPVRTYTGDPPVAEDEVLEGLKSPHDRTRVAAARAAVVQQLQIPGERLAQLFHDNEGDVLWLATEITLQQANMAMDVGIEGIVNLIRQNDDYVVGLGYQHFMQFTRQGELLVDYLFRQREIAPDVAVAARLLADLDWERFISLPCNIPAHCLAKWFEKAWVLCGSALCLNWRQNPRALYENAFEQIRMFDAPADDLANRISELESLFKLMNRQSVKSIKDGPIFEAADSLLAHGHDLRGLVLAMLEAPLSHVVHGAFRLLTRLWWDDCAELLIGHLDSSASRRKGAVRALIDIGEPAIGPITQALQTTRNPRTAVMCIEILGRTRKPSVLPLMEERLNHPNDRIRFNVRRVLEMYFGMELPPEEEEETVPDASEAEEH